MQDVHFPVIRDAPSPQVYIEHSLPRIRSSFRLPRRLASGQLLGVTARRHTVTLEAPSPPLRLDGGRRGALQAIYTRPTLSDPNVSFLANTIMEAQGVPGERQRKAEDTLDGMTDDILARARMNNFDDNPHFQIAFIVDDYHRTDANRPFADREHHFGVVFLQFVDDRIDIQLWRDAKGVARDAHKLHVYPEGHDELYLRVGSPSWKPVRLTNVQAKKCRQDVSWVRRHGARLIPFRYVHDEWARLGVQGTGQTLKDVAEASDAVAG